jgi:hypothetical protein
MHGNLPRLPEYGGRGVEVARLLAVPRRLASVYAPEVLARFGTGAARIEARIVAPDGYVLTIEFGAPTLLGMIR